MRRRPNNSRACPSSTTSTTASVLQNYDSDNDIDNDERFEHDLIRSHGYNYNDQDEGIEEDDDDMHRGITGDHFTSIFHQPYSNANFPFRSIRRGSHIDVLDQDGYWYAAEVWKQNKKHSSVLVSTLYSLFHSFFPFIELRILLIYLKVPKLRPF